MGSNLWWEEACDGFIPVYAVEIGVNIGGENLYVGRARANGDIVPGMVGQQLGGCHIIHNGEEKILTEYDVLICRDCDNLTWRRSYTSEAIPCGAIVGGRVGKMNELVYIARGRVPEYPKAVYGGAMQKNKPVVVPFSGKKVQLMEYQILCDTYCV